MPLSLIKTNSIAAGNITSALITSVANTAIVGRIATAQQPTGAILQVQQVASVGLSASQGTYPNFVYLLSLLLQLKEREGERKKGRIITYFSGVRQNAFCQMTLIPNG